MTSNEILNANVIDIIFENRNKVYGAYELRTHYNKRLAVSLLATCVLLLIAAFFVRVPELVAVPPLASLPKDPVIVRIPHEPLPIAAPVVVKPRKAQVAGEKYINNFQIVPDLQDTDFPEVDVLVTKTFSNEQSDRSPSAHGEAAGFSGGQTGSEGDTTSSLPATDFVAVEKNANFPGGQQAWLQFLNKHLRSPDELGAGEKRMVLMRFVVGADGKITQFEIIQSGGTSFDREVIRVLKKMPDWEPAIQNGNRVSVVFTQPVTFLSVAE